MKVVDYAFISWKTYDLTYLNFSLQIDAKIHSLFSRTFIVEFFVQASQSRGLMLTLTFLSIRFVRPAHTYTYLSSKVFAQSFLPLSLDAPMDEGQSLVYRVYKQEREYQLTLLIADYMKP